MKQKVVITGSSGFLGSHLIKQLEKFRMEPIYLIYNSHDDIIKDGKGLNVFYYDNLLDKKLQSDLKELEPSIFIHCAWKGIKGNERNLDDHFTYNLPLTYSSVLLASKIGCKTWVGIGSQAEYGIQNVKLKETALLNPLNAYGRSKVSAFWGVQGLCNSNNMKMIWARIFSLYGPGDNTSFFIPYIINQIKNNQQPIITNCDQNWDYLYIDDAVCAILSLLKCDSQGVFNIGSGVSIKLKNVVELIKNNINPNFHINYGYLPKPAEFISHLEADIEKLKMTTNWEPKISLEVGIKKTINYYINK